MSDLGLHTGARAIRVPQVISYAQKPDRDENRFDRWLQRRIGQVVAQGAGLRARGLRSIAKHAATHEPALQALDDEGLQDFGRALRLRQHDLARMTAKQAAPYFALVREASRRISGMRHYDVQLMGAWAMLKGQIAEMRTGEGKTLCATAAAATAGLLGLPVHMITVNDYLAERDAEEMRALYEFLGLSVGVLRPKQDLAQRQGIYACDIVYGSSKEIAFDYLRDRMVLRHAPGNLRHKVSALTGQGGGDLRMRGLHVAIVDEGDSVLIDEARTPLIISGGEDEGADDMSLLSRAMEAAKALVDGKDYRLDADSSIIELHPQGQDRLEDMAEDELEMAYAAGLTPQMGGFDVAVIREHAVVQALSAMHLYQRDIHYILRDDKVMIVDENTGRVMPDRSWSELLHQMVELKEGVELSERRNTLGRITFQRYFRRYRFLGAMTGTARDAAVELWSVYRLPVSKIPTNLPDARTFGRDQIFRREAAKWQAIATRVQGLHQQGVPVLLGTRSVAGSDAASARLQELGVPHQVLSARQDADEADIVARAGQVGCVTVATNMAGRGTDIKLPKAAKAAGGLHVILSERHDSRRIDRQLEGRCGRQGDPGQVEVFLSLEDEMLRPKNARIWRQVAGLCLAVSPRLAGRVIRLRQMYIERLHAGMRHDLLETDRTLGERLAFSGEVE